MKFRCIVCAILCALIVCAGAPVGWSADSPKPIKVLFEVGGSDYHDAVKLPALLKKVLDDTGSFAVTITQDRDQFKAANIGNYDLVIIYTTFGELTKEQEAGLIGFVEGGKGLIGIHSATDSFKNSDAYWKLLGGRFTTHQSGTFKVKITAKRHVICQGLHDFEINDETYCHNFNPESKLIVLMRRETDNEPVAWVRYVGKGRVFVTGLGHGGQAWENPGFQALITRAGLWAAGRIGP